MNDKPDKNSDGILGETAQKYSFIADYTNDIFYSSDPEGIVTFISRQIMRYGYNPEDIVSRSLLDYVIPQDRERVALDYQKTINSGEEFPTAFRIADKNGNIVWLEDYGRIVRDGTGKVTGVAGILRDITRHKELEARFKEREAMCHAIYDFMPDLLYRVNAEGKIVDCSDSVVKTLGYSRQELIGTRVYDLYADGSKSFAKECFEEWLKTGQLRNKILTIVTKSGVERQVELNVNAIYDDDGKIISSISVQRDITERKRAEDALRSSEQLLQNIINAGQVCIFVKDRDGRYLMANKVRAELYGVTTAQLIGRTDREFLGNAGVLLEEIEQITAVDRDVIATKTPRFVPSEKITMSDGSARWFQTNKAPLSIEGQGDCVLGISVDITEQKKIEEALSKSYKELKSLQTQMVQAEKMAGIGQLAAGVAHEINNPLLYITMNLGYMAEYVKNFSEAVVELRELAVKISGQTPVDIEALRQGLDAIFTKMKVENIHKDFGDIINETLEGTMRIKKIVENLREFAHPGEKMIQNVNMNEVIDKALTLVWNEIRQKCKVIKDFQPVPDILCNAGQLSQVFVNLLVNSYQAITERGDIIIKTYVKDDNVVIEVTDTGPGIPEQHLNKIFDPFFTTKEVGKGTGLGLAIVYGIIRRHRGTISVVSKVGVGTTFVLRLPIQPPEEKK